MNHGPFTTFTGYEVTTMPVSFVSVRYYAQLDDDCESFDTLMEALCYAENVDRARDLSAEALAYFNTSGVLVD